MNPITCIKCKKILPKYDDVEIVDDDLVLSYTCNHCGISQLKIYTFIDDIEYTKFIL